MLRRLVSRVLVCALTASLTAVLSTATTPAFAADGDVMTAQWVTNAGTGGQVTRAASVTTYAAGGARFATAAIGGRVVTLSPPTGTRFQPGQTYDVAGTATASLARLTTSSIFSTPCVVAGSVTVLEAEYDADGLLTTFAADYRATCSPFGKADESAVGSVRHNSSAPYVGLVPSYTPDVVAVGRNRITTATVRGSGPGSVTLGQASLSGRRAVDYRVVNNGCAAVTLTDGVECPVSLQFAPEQLSYGNRDERIAELTLQASGHLSETVRIRLNSQGEELPGAPELATTFPTPNGVGVSWRGAWPSAQRYRVDRRFSETDPWTEVAMVEYPGSAPWLWVDEDVSPGQHVSYRVTGINSGWEGPSQVVSTTRSLTTPSPGSDSLVAYGSTASGGPSAVVRSTDPGAVVAATTATTIEARNDPASPNRVDLTFRTPVVPGPGEYRKASGIFGGASFSESSYNCGYVDSVLEVRSAVYDEALKPLVFDASYVGWCGNGTVVRVEIRLGVDGSYAMTTSDPTTVGPFTTYGGSSESGLVTVANSGPDPLNVGPATVRGDAADDWTVTNNGCAGRVLEVAETCDVTMSFSSTADGERPARLEIALQHASGPIAPHVVLLSGLGATPPSVPTFASVAGTIGAITAWWEPPFYDGGYPVDSYQLQRAPAGGSYTTIATTAGGKYIDRAVTPERDYSYRIRAANQVGTGPWHVFPDNPVRTLERAVVVSGEDVAGAPRGLFLVRDWRWDAPEVPLGTDTSFDHRDPAASPAGTKLAYSRSTNAGVGDDGEYDLWTGSIKNPAGVRLTSMPGAETDAAYSPDASQIAFTHEAANGQRSVWVVPADGGTPEQLAPDAAAPAWTPDGSGVVVENDSNVDAPLLRVTLADGRSIPVPGTAGGSEPTVARDGRIAFVDATGRALAELATGGVTPTVLKSALSGRTYQAPAYGVTGDLFVQETQPNTGQMYVYQLHANSSLSGRRCNYGEPAPIILDRYAPWVSAGGVAAYVRGSLTVNIEYGDYEETPQAALRPECRLDSASWKPCRGSVTFLSLSEGEHRLTVRLTDEAGHTTQDTHGFISDTTKPSVRFGRPRSPSTLDRTAQFTWSGSDRSTFVETYEVSYRRATATRGFSAYQRPSGWPSRTQRTRLPLPIRPGQEICVRVRSLDAAGHYSAYRERCIGQPQDDRALVASAGWRRVKAMRVWRDTESVSTRRGATLRSAVPVTARRVGILATTCPACGAVKVYVGRRYVGSVSLSSARPRLRQLRLLPLQLKARTGRLTLKTTSRAPVRIDGILLRRT